MSTIQYNQKFNDALKRTATKNLSKPQFLPEFDKRYLNQKTILQIQHIFQDAGIKPDELFKKCFQFHAEIKKPLEILLNTKVYYTIGGVNLEDSNFFVLSEQDIDNYLENGVKGTMKAHAWLTLPSMEIIDFTLPTTYLMMSGDFNGIAHVFTKHADELAKSNIVYNPMLIGTEFMFKIGAVIGNPTWI